MTKETPASLAAFAGPVRMTPTQLSERSEWEEAVAGYHAGINGSTIRRWLIREKGYADGELPSADSITKFLRNNHSR